MQRLREKRLKSKLQMESAKIMLTLDEIESFEALDLELKMKKDILKNEMKKYLFKKSFFTFRNSSPN
jgi:hypothetical protein